MTQYGAARMTQYGAARMTQYGAARMTQYGAARMTQYGAARMTQYGAARMTQYGAARMTQYGAARIRRTEIMLIFEENSILIYLLRKLTKTAYAGIWTCWYGTFYKVVSRKNFEPKFQIFSDKLGFWDIS